MANVGNAFIIRLKTFILTFFTFLSFFNVFHFYPNVIISMMYTACYYITPVAIIRLYTHSLFTKIDIDIDIKFAAQGIKTRKRFKTRPQNGDNYSF